MIKRTDYRAVRQACRFIALTDEVSIRRDAQIGLRRKGSGVVLAGLADQVLAEFRRQRVRRDG